MKIKILLSVFLLFMASVVIGAFVWRGLAKNENGAVVFSKPLSPGDEGSTSLALTDLPSPKTLAPADRVAVASVVDANNQFAFDLYSHYSKAQTGNIFFSPFSVVTALTMAAEGARGQTANEMHKVLHLSNNEEVRRIAAATLYGRLNATGTGYTLKIANALWVDKSYPLLTAFRSVITTYYQGDLANLDFRGNREDSRKTINNWVADHTGGKVQNLIPSGSIDDLTRLILTDAIYFKGTWSVPFDKAHTRPADFRVNSDTKVRVEMMSLTGEKAKFPYAETQNMQVLELPYSGNRLSMLILLPKGRDLATIENALSTTTLTAIRTSLVKQRVDIYLPRFTLGTTYLMNDDLKSMGMPMAFYDAADFSGMTGSKDLSISQVIHKAFVDVNEEGTEASAATGVSMETLGLEQGPPKIPIFRADHPFIFMIEDDGSGNTLFIGRVLIPDSR
jgi:serpin B